MKVVGIRDLKDNPSRALRAARTDPVLITNRDDPEAVLLSLRGLGEHEADVRLTLAATLYNEGVLSLGRAARLADVPLECFIEHLDSRSIPVFRLDRTELDSDLEALRG
jgi:prevent-host-death family protein